jgi:hypothetical protein
MRLSVTARALPIVAALLIASASDASPQRLASWQADGSPVFFDGDYYCPAGATIYFDPNTMVESGEFEGVPLYVDTTIEPNSIVYAPIGGRLLRPYERPRVGNKAGTVGSRTPSFPVHLAAEAWRVRTPSDALAFCGHPVVVNEFPSRVFLEPEPPEDRDDDSVSGQPGRPGTVRSAALPASNNGIWIEFGGARWAVSAAPNGPTLSQLVEIGRYRDSPVYQRRGGDSPWELFVRASPQGRLTRLIRID